MREIHTSLDLCPYSAECECITRMQYTQWGELFGNPKFGDMPAGGFCRNARYDGNDVFEINIHQVLYLATMFLVGMDQTMND